MSLPVEYRHKCDTSAPAVRIFHGAKGAKKRNITTKSTKDTKLGEEGEIG